MPAINITDETFKKHISEAILLMIGPESRDKLIAEALENLCERKITENPRGKDFEHPSRMQYLFHKAVSEIADAEMNRLVKEDAQITAAVQGFIKKAMLHVLENNGFNSAIMDTFQKAIQERLWG